MLKYLISLLVIILIYFIYLNLKKENIWMYWENKRNKDRPKYIDLCFDTIKKHCSKDFKINILNEKTIHNYLPNLRPDIQYKLSIPQKTDYYRYNLLYKYGGIWLDADTILFSSLKKLLKHLNKYDYIGSGCHDKKCKNTGYPKPSNGVMISRKNTKFMRMCISYCDRLLDNVLDKKINYFDLGRNNMWENIELLRSEGWDYYHCSSICLERDSNDKKFVNKRFISNEDIDEKCKGNLIYIPIYNTAPGFPLWFKNLSKDDILKGFMLISKLFRLSLSN